MYVYPITFFESDGKTVAANGELVTDVSLQTQDWNVLPANNGTQYSGYPAGNVPTPSWTGQLPNLLNLNAAYSINIATTYVSPSTGITIALNGTLPTGWAFSSVTNLLTYDGTHVSGPNTVSFTATLTGPNTTSTSNSFTVSGVGGTSSDVTAPIIPLLLSASNVLQTSATLSGLASADPAPSGATWSGMKQYNVAVTGAPGSPFTVNAADLGVKATVIFGDIGPQTSTITQSGASLTFTTTAVDAPYPTNSALAFAYLQLTGTSWTIHCRVPSTFTSTGAYDNLRMEARPTLSTTDAYVAVQCRNLSGASPGVNSEARPSSGGSSATIVSTSTPAETIDLFLNRNGDTYTFYWSSDGNTLQSLGTATQVMGSTIYVGWGANTASGGPMTAQQMTQCSITTDPNWSLALTGLSAATAYPYSVTAQDVAGNVSAAGSSTFTTASASGTSLPYPITMSIQLNSPGGSAGNSAWQQSEARKNYVVLQGEGFQGGTNYAADFLAMKNYAAANLPGHVLKTGFYTQHDEWFTTTSGNSSLDTPLINFGLGNSIGSGNTQSASYLRSSWPGGGFVTGVAGSTYYCANWSDDCPTSNIAKVGSVTGPGVVNWSQFAAWYDYQSLVNGNLAAMGNGTSAFPSNPYVDLFYFDNLFMYPRSSGCWLSTSTSYGSGTSAMNSVRPHGENGWIQAFTMHRSLQPGVLCGGNFDGVGFQGNGTNPQVVDTTGISELVSSENTLYWQGQYRTFANYISGLVGQEAYAVGQRPDYCWYNAEGPGAPNEFWNGVSQSSWSAHDWQSARYQLGIALLLRWVFGFQVPNGSNSWWMDEFDAGVGHLGYLGSPVGTRNYTNPTNGPVFVIPFTGGKAYFYPAGTNDSVSGLNSYTVTGVSGHHIKYTVTPSGSQPSGVISQAAFTSVTVQPRDCILTLP